MINLANNKFRIIYPKSLIETPLKYAKNRDFSQLIGILGEKSKK